MIHLQAHGSLIFALINHQFTGTAVQCPKNMPTCIIHQYVMVFISMRQSKMTIWNIAIQPNRPNSKDVSDKISALAAR